MIDVCWHEGAEGFKRPTGRSRYSCCTMLNQMFDQYDCIHWSTFANVPQDAEGAVLMIQGGNERRRVDEISRDASRLRWVIFVLIGDEACDFPLGTLARHPNSKTWFQMPQPGHTVADRYFPVGYSKDTPALASKTQDRTLDWFFAGQDTHERRHQCVAQLTSMLGGLLVPTKGFMQGLPQDEYFGYMARARVIPCPSGPASPDSFRWAEALESGCVPIADGRTPRYSGSDYWGFVFGAVPFPVIYDWSMLPRVMEETLANWDTLTNECQRWWAAYKTKFNVWLGEDIVCLKS